MTDEMEAEVLDEQDAALARIERSEVIAAQSHALNWSREQIQLLKATVAKDASDAELDLFLHVCSRTGLDPFARQIYAIKRQGKMTIQTSIDGFRLIAERSDKYVGQVGPFWCAKDGAWVDVWLRDDPPYAARVGALRLGYAEPLWGTALWREFAPQDMSKTDAFMWKRMGSHQLAKCAEALALRRAFPQELGGLYTTDEMRAAVVSTAAVPPIEAPRVPPDHRQRVDAVKRAMAEKNTIVGLAQVWSAATAFVADLRSAAPDLARELDVDHEANEKRVGVSKVSGVSKHRADVDMVKKRMEKMRDAEKLGELWSRNEEWRLTLHEEAPDLEKELNAFYVDQIKRVGTPL